MEHDRDVARGPGEERLQPGAVALELPDRLPPALQRALVLRPRPQGMLQVGRALALGRLGPLPGLAGELLVQGRDLIGRALLEAREALLDQVLDRAGQPHLRLAHAQHERPEL